MLPPRRAQARRLAAAAAVLALGWAGCAGPSAAGGPAPARGLSAADARAALERFVGALEAGRAGEAHALLASRWREASSPARLATDLRGAGPYAADQLARVRAALAAGTPVEVSGGVARLPVGGARAARLVAEDGGWRLDALE